jgi:DNA-binding MarR family transcriptional regulator
MTEAAQPFLPPDPKGEFPYEVSMLLLNLLVAVPRLRDVDLERVLRPTGLNLAKYRTLLTMSRLGECTMSALATITTVDRTTLTRIIDPLERDGLVARGEQAADRRKVSLRVTPAGKNRLTAAQALVGARNAEILAEVPEGMKRTMLRGLARMQRALGASREEMTRILEQQGAAD